MDNKTPPPSHSSKLSWSSAAPGTPAPPYSPYSSPPTPSSPLFGLPFGRSMRLPSSTRHYLRKRRAGLASLLPGITILVLAVMLFLTARQECRPIQVVQQMGVRGAGVDERLAVRSWVRGAPKSRLVDNLKPGEKYITTFVSSGWTNDVMTYGNLLYLSLLTQRTPILGPFVPSHLSSSAGYIPFSDVFDLPRLAKAMNWPVIEWTDVKDPENGVEEELGCWSAWMGGSRHVMEPRWSWVPSVFGLDVSYTPVPYDYKLFPDNEQNPHLKYGKLTELSFPTERKRALSLSSPRPSKAGHTLEPSDQLMCFDQLYAVSVESEWEWFTDSSPVWRFVGRHMRWNRNAEALARQYLARHWGLAKGEKLPPFISVHARRGDFGNHCKHMGYDGTSCLPTLNQLQRRIAEVRLALARKGLQADAAHMPVLITSDETSPTWWASIADAGYTWIDHSEAKTAEVYGEWYAPVLDAIFHSMAVGFVGTDQSTMSFLAGRRVEEWNGGVVTYLKWTGVDPEEL